ncbi:hypothetical protein [Bradyrhizobium sp. CCBAU 11357]|uniref:hypothetical protein n=1 Tax=Bradyrhizobium sp. CCBAU 11357 TaxID=1630808 RepID=UPI002304CD13|nr:hypothetical protein [Bradyrhizobium sp. CCBAU 11357]MDA9498440.1 hypothetical protein [Bradyrhizobium sp. CCBAU 11357]
MALPKQGIATATIRGSDGQDFTLAVPAVLHGERLHISADHHSTLRFAMHSAGVENAELEFSEMEVA